MDQSGRVQNGLFFGNSLSNNQKLGGRDGRDGSANPGLWGWAYCGPIRGPYGPLFNIHILIKVIYLYHLYPPELRPSRFNDLGQELWQ